MDDRAIKQWLSALGSISYYELFRVAPTATHDELHGAFHAFAEAFHPDAHRWRPLDQQEAIGTIYRRGTEAWRVLSEPALRTRYDAAVAHGNLRPEDLLEVERPPRSLGGGGAGALVDQVRSPGARPFVLRAEQLFKKGDPKQAKIQLVVAMHMDRGNASLEAFGKELDEAIRARIEQEKSGRRS